jgi:hypothetical protein
VAGITGRRAVGLIQSGRLSLCRQGHELVVQIKRLVPDRRCLKRADSGPTEVAAKGKNLARSGLTPVVMAAPQPGDLGRFGRRRAPTSTGDRREPRL